MNVLLTINKKTFFILIIFLTTTTHISAQKGDSTFWNQVLFGGGLGLNFGDNYFSATIAPSAIYEFNKHIATGLGLNATFNNQKGHFKTTILGGSLIALGNIFQTFQLSAEYEHLHVNRRYNVNLGIPDDRYWSPALFLGAGYRSRNVTFGIRYDILYDHTKSIYADSWMPFVRFYF